jgi:hypothetical protein
MMDYAALMQILSTPRPNGSAAETRTRLALQAWLEQRGIPYRLQAFRLYPHIWTGIGAWLIVSRSLLALAILLRWGWPATAIALLGLLGGLVDVALGIPLVSWPGATQGQNLVLEFSPAAPRRELLLSAHYDTKTELLDHRQRMFFVRMLPTGIAITAALGLLGPLDRALWLAGSPWAGLSYACAMVLSLFLLVLAWGLGANLALGGLRARWGGASQGAVDNGAACAILLGLAERVQRGELRLEHTRLTLLLFGGEEVNMQGSLAYVRQRAWPLPASALNLEVMAQDGEYVLWEQDGLSLRLWPCSEEINQAAAAAVQAVTGAAPRRVGPVNSDGGSFLRAGIPASTLGTYDKALVDRGFHGPADHLGRVVMARLPEAAEILAQFILHFEKLEAGAFKGGRG